MDPNTRRVASTVADALDGDEVVVSFNLYYYCRDKKLTPAGTHYLQADFFQEELIDLPHPRDSDSASISSVATTRSRLCAFTSLGRTFTNASKDSIDLDGQPRTFTLSQLCDFIAKHPSLQTAGIVSCSCYAQRTSLLVIHRFLILQLRRTGRKDVWLRLDRLRSPNVALIEFSLTGGVTPSNDMVRSL